MVEPHWQVRRGMAFANKKLMRLHWWARSAPVELVSERGATELPELGLSDPVGHVHPNNSRTVPRLTCDTLGAAEVGGCEGNSNEITKG